MDKCSIISNEPKKAHTFVMDERIRKLEMTHTFVGYGLDPCSLTTCPKKTIS
jgi:hypothetical protein